MNERSVAIHFLPGIGTTHQGLDGLKKHLETVPDVTKVVMENSVLSSDPTTPNRFPSMGDRILATYHEQEQKQGTTVIGLHSGAGGEFPPVWNYMMKKDPEFIRRQLINTYFVNIGVAGLRNGIDGFFTTFAGLSRITRSQLSTPLVHRFPTEVAGIETLNIFDNPNLHPNTTEALRKLFPDRSNYREGLSTLPYQSDYRYLALIQDENAQQKITEIDKQINDIVDETTSTTPNQEHQEERKNLLKDPIRDLLKMRAKLLNPYSEKAWQGGNKYQSFETDFPQTSRQTRLTLACQAVTDQLAGLKAILWGETGQIYSQLIKDGLPSSHIRFLVPEYDTFVPLKDLEKACQRWQIGDNLQDRIILMERHTHSSWSPLGKPFAQAIHLILETI